QLLSFIKAELKPTFKVALLSNVGRGWLDDFFTKEDLHDLFDAVVLSSEIGIIKPDERAYVIAADRLGLPPDECIMIDDRLDNCHG
ncbi:haloacid dehalogenase, partial [Candidatus Saccharibacteria bacterium]